MEPEQLDTMFRIRAKEESETINDPMALERIMEKEFGYNVTIENGILQFDTHEGIQVLNDDKFMDLEESLSIIKHPCNFYIGPHKHNFIEMIYVYSGECTQVINNQEVTLYSGDICILDKNTVHSITPVSEEDIIINILMRTSYFDNTMLSRLSGNDLISNFLIQAVYQSKEYNHFLLFRSGSNKKIRQWMVDLMCEYFHKSLCSYEIINCYIVLIFSELLRVYQTRTHEVHYPTNNRINISDVLSFLENNYKNATLASTAEQFNFHPNYLSSLLTKKTGKPFKAHLQELKLRKACLLLKNTDMSVEAICKEVGYENKTFFYKKFKEMFQYSPSKVRELNRKRTL